jgi:hypothetical protein
MMVGGLFEIYRLVQKNMKRVEKFTISQMKIVTLKNRFEQDVAGFNTIWFTQRATNQKDLLDGQTMEAPEKVEKNQFLYSKNNKGNLEKLTFMTTAAMQTFDNQESFVRVAYELREDKHNNGLYALYRKEDVIVSERINEESLEEAKSYIVADGIQSIQMRYHYLDVQLAKLHAQGKELSKPAIRSAKQWGVTAKEDSEEEEYAVGVKVPKFIQMQITFGEIEHVQQEETFDLYFSIPSFMDGPPKDYAQIHKQHVNKVEEKSANVPQPTGSNNA